MEFDRLIQKRRSVRLYDSSQKVLVKHIQELVATALQAPSWKNSQTGRYYAVFGEETLAKVRSCLNNKNQQTTKDVNVLLVTTFVKGVSGFNQTGDPENELADGWGCYDLGLQNAYLLLKAADMGIDSVVLGMRDAAALQQVLDIPDNEQVVAVIALGYRGQQEIKTPARKSLHDVLKFR